MLSTFDFNTDGTIDMQFSFYNGTINTRQFYTALTSTHVNFTFVNYPRYEALPAVPQGYYPPKNEGHLIQRSNTDNLSLGIRHSRFDDKYQASHLVNGWILNDATQYKKFYYGPYDQADIVTVASLVFSKSLDFVYGE
ncbi:hypothetical protein D3C73_1056720 [compost metagenome]